MAYTDLRQELQPRVYFIQTRLEVDMSRFKMWRDPSKINFAKLLNTISFDEHRNALVSQYVQRAASKGRTVLVLGERVEQLLLLSAECGDIASPLVGPMKPADREAAMKKQVVFATAALAKEGLDRPAFDTLVILVPTTNPAWLQQAFGRILRKYDDKKSPCIVIFEDVEIAPMRSRCDKIRVWLRQQKFEHSTIKGESNV